MAEKFPTPQERAMACLLEATEIGGMSRPETALYAYQAGFTAALDLCTEIETRLNKYAAHHSQLRRYRRIVG